MSEDKLPGLILPVLVGSAALALAIAAATMLLSSFFLRVLGKTGVSVQFVYDGLVKLRVVAGGLTLQRLPRRPAVAIFTT